MLKAENSDIISFISFSFFRIIHRKDLSILNLVVFFVSLRQGITKIQLKKTCTFFSSGLPTFLQTFFTLTINIFLSL